MPVPLLPPRRCRAARFQTASNGFAPPSPAIRVAVSQHDEKIPRSDGPCRRALFSDGLRRPLQKTPFPLQTRRRCRRPRSGGRGRSSGLRARAGGFRAGRRAARRAQAAGRRRAGNRRRRLSGAGFAKRPDPHRPRFGQTGRTGLAHQADDRLSGLQSPRKRQAQRNRHPHALRKSLARRGLAHVPQRGQTRCRGRSAQRTDRPVG